MASSSIVSVDIGAFTVKVAEFSQGRNGGLVLQGFYIEELGVDPAKESDNREVVRKALEKIFQENGIKSNRVAYTISGQSVFPKFIKLPPIDKPEKISQIIKFEAQQNVPFPIDQVVWGYEVISPPGSLEMEIALFAVKSELIEENYALFNGVGLIPVLTDLSPMAIYNSFIHNYGDPKEPTLLVDIGGKSTNLIFCEGTRFFCRTIPVGGNNLTQSIATEFGVPFAEAEKLKKDKGFVGLGGAYEDPKDPDVARISKLVRQGMTKLHAEVTRSANFYRTQQGGRAPERIYLSGGSSVMPYTIQFFKEKLNAPVDYVNFFRQIEVAPSIPEDALEAARQCMGELTGLALRQTTECAVELNLEPPSVIARRTARIKRPLYAGISAAILASVFVWWLSLFIQARELEAELKRTEEIQRHFSGSKSQLEQSIRNHAAHAASLEDLVSVIAQKNYWAEVFKALNRPIHQDMWITGLESTSNTLPIPELDRPRDPAPTKPGPPAKRNAAPAPEAPKAVVYRIEGMCRVPAPHEPGADLKKVENQIVYKYVDALAQDKQFFVIPDVSQAIKKLAEPKQNDVVYTFEIEIGIKPASAFVEAQDIQVPEAKLPEGIKP